MLARKCSDRNKAKLDQKIALAYSYAMKISLVKVDYFSACPSTPICVSILTSLVVFICLFGFNANAHKANVAEKPIVITFASDNNNPPTQYTINGTPVGLLVDVIKMVDTRLDKFDIEIQPSSWPKAKNKVRRGEALGLVGSFFHGHDWPNLYPYSYPIMYDTLVSICNEESNIPEGAQWPQDYQGLKVGTVTGYDGWLNSGINYREKGIANFFQYPNAPLAISAVNKSLVDCTLFEESGYRAYQSKQEEGQNSEVGSNLRITSYISRHSIHIAYSQKMLNAGNHPYAREFIKAFDKALFELLISGQLKPILTKYDINDPVFDF